MNTVRQVLTLIVVAISQYSNEILLDKQVVELPDNPIAVSYTHLDVYKRQL